MLDLAECQSQADVVQLFECGEDEASVRSHIPSYFVPKDIGSFAHSEAKNR